MHSPGHCATCAAVVPRHCNPHRFPTQIGDYVDIKANSAIQKGMPHKTYHGRTGIVFNVTRRALGVEVNKQARASPASPRAAAAATA